MRVVGTDIHRSFAQVAILDNGSIVREQRVELIRDRFFAIRGIAEHGRRGRDRGDWQQHGRRTALTAICKARHRGEFPSREGHRLGASEVGQGRCRF